MKLPVPSARPSLVFIALSAAVATTSVAAAQAPTRPAFRFLRQDEDWSSFADPSQHSATGDAWKHMTLSNDGSTWVSIGGSFRTRVEVWENFNFGAPPTANHDDTFVLTRARLHADLHLSESVRVFGELKTAQTTDRDLPGGTRGLDRDTFDLQQLFVETDFSCAADHDLTVRAGRQMLSFGAQRLVSPLPWGNALRAWDGLTATLTDGPWQVTGIATAFVPVDKTDYNEADSDELLYGIYAKRANEGGQPGGREFYWLANTRDNVMVNGTAGDAKRHTLGARAHGPLGGNLDGDVEVAYQLGEVGAGDVSAWSFASQLGYRPGGGTTRCWLGLDWASGDNNPGGDVQTFDQLYPLGHAYFGFIDAVGRQNAIDSSIGLSCKAAEKVTLLLAGHSFWLADKSDALYNAGGAPSRAPGSFQSSWLGWEVDATATWKPERHVATQVGVSRFFAGDALEESGPSEDVDFAYLSVNFTF